MEEKKSFLDSTTDGMWGFIKGALTGGVIGALAGAAIAGIAALVFPGVGEVLGAAITGQAATLSKVGVTLVGGLVGASTFGAIGGYSGMATEVIRGRESTQISGQDVANVAKISYAQGMMVGHNIAQEQQAEVTTKFRDKVAQQRAQTQQAQKTH